MMNKKIDEDRELANVESSETFLADQSNAQSTITADGISNGMQKAPTSEKKRRHQEMTEEERREERRAANRRSAFESRQRRKVLIEELQDTVQAMSKENAAVSKEADSLRAQVDMLLRENRQLRFQQQLTNSRLPMPGLPETNSHQLGGGALWGMHQQQQQGMNSNTGGVAGLSALDQYFNSDQHNHVGPMLGGGVAQSGIDMSNPIQAPPTDSLLAEQAREYLRSLSDRNNRML